jgi:hypothetical protein
LTPHAVILIPFAVILIPPCGRRISLHPPRINCAKNLALDFSARKEQGEMLRGVYPDPAAAGERAQHDISESSMTTDN